ncbi:hypothetical protein AB6A40_009563 [Gnathostoma spinigerum]|uniref:BCAS3 WD40 domain-containing protein n=1 Tax=Gnathostoma spinigerum TaxID=75299 RepID=A0ABD6EXH3_9BILA
MTAASARNKKHGQTASKERQNDPIDCGSTSAIVQPIQVLQVQPQKQRTQQSQCATPSTTAHSSSSSVYTGLHPTRPHKDNDVTSVYFQRGQCIRPQSVAESSIVGSMAELVREVIPQSSKPTSPQAEAEHIDWVSFQKCPKGSDQRRIANIVVLGLLRGYQIWIVKENGECEEVLSEKKGPLRTGHILPANPEASFGIHKDRFESDRPLFAMVPVDPDCSHSTVSFLSLKSAKIVHSLTYPDPICRLDASTKIFVMSFTDCIVILDAMSLTQQRCIFDCLAVDGLYCPLALSDIFIAFGDREFHQMNQSSGGMVSAEETSSLPSSYSSSMLSAVKSLSKTVSAVGEAMMLRSSLSSSPQSKQLINSLTHPGIVTVVDATKLPTENDDIVRCKFLFVY